MLQIFQRQSEGALQHWQRHLEGDWQIWQALRNTLRRKFLSALASEDVLKHLKTSQNLAINTKFSSSKSRDTVPLRP